MSSTSQEGDIAVAEKIEIKEPSQYNVIVHDNDITSYDEVIYIISHSFGMDYDTAFKIAQSVDSAGQGVCGTYSKEIAETKLDITDMIKHSLISLMPVRKREIEALKFTLEKA